MKAVVVWDFGPVEEHKLSKMEEPRPDAGEVLVDLVASETNYPDLLCVEGNYQRKPALPFSPGKGGAGRISELGEGVSGFSVGQKVLILPDFGTYAEKAVAPVECCFPVPEKVPFDTAAALGLAYQTAYFALVECGGFRTGETVLVLGASGGVGLAAVQLAKALGAKKVVAATRSEEGARLARSTGADAIVGAADPNLRDTMREEVYVATDGHGADVVIDPVGGAIAEASLRVMAWRGRLVVVGFASGDFPKFMGNYLLIKGISIHGFRWTEYRLRQLERVRDVQARLFELWARRQIEPLISKVLPLENFAEALEALRTGSVQGKIILRTDSAATNQEG